MGIPVMILGKSGCGKSTSIRNLENVGVFNVLGKSLPFRSKEAIKEVMTDDYNKIKQTLFKSELKTFIIDDATYLMTNKFMKNQNNDNVKGNKVFEFYNQLAQDFWDLIQFITKELPADKIVYMLMHEEANDLGDIKPKTIGKMLDDKVCVEGMFTIVLRSFKEGNRYLFRTQSNGSDVAKSPFEMFEEIIENDLKMVDENIREFYNLKGENK